MLVIGGFFVMKKILVGVLGVGIIFTLFGCSQVKAHVKSMEKPEYEKIEDVRGILDKVLAHIAESSSELSFENGELLDSELGVPHYETLPFSEIEHFNEKDVVDGFIVRPVVDVENPKLLIVIEAVDKEACSNLLKGLEKVKSDQMVEFKDSGILTKYLINENKTVRQGNFLFYVTWEKPEEIVKVFERHVK